VSGGGHLVGNQAAHGRFANLKDLGRFLQGDLAALSTLTLAVGSDPAMIAQPAYAGTGPAVVAAGRLASGCCDVLRRARWARGADRGRAPPRSKQNRAALDDAV
jgi:hypothetical protein